MTITRPVWAEINLDHLAHNMREIRRITSAGTSIAAVIKADGYGHGSSYIVETLLENGADSFAVSTLSEAIRLRQIVVDKEILILGYTPEELVAELAKYNLIQTIYSVEQALAFNEFALSHNTKIRVHLKIDTGMHRLGFLVNEAGIAEILDCYHLKGLLIEGVFTHFACADQLDQSVTMKQLERFKKVTSIIESAGHRIKVKHCANSAAILALEDYDFDMVRVGAMLFGIYPSEYHRDRLHLKEVMSIKAMISQVKKVPAGEGISYGHIYRTRGEEVIASLPLGYADGFSRLLSGKTYVLYHGKKAEVVGNICMDQCMIRLDDALAKRGDIVTIFGEDHGTFKSIDEVAAELGTINYEVICMIDKRIPRHYFKGGKLIRVNDDLLNLANGWNNGL